MGRSRYCFGDLEQPYFLTLTVLHWIPLFTHPESVGIVLDGLRHLIAQHLRLHAWVILENHLHLLAQSPTLDRDIARLKSFTARRLVEWLTARGAKTVLDQMAFYRKAHKKADRALQVWQEGVHPQQVKDEAMMRDMVKYIHQNPVARGYVDLAAHWRYSSARDYDGRPGMLELAPWPGRDMHSHAERGNEV